MEPTDLTIEILKSIRDEVRATNSRLDQTNQRLDQTNQRLDQTNQRLGDTNEQIETGLGRLQQRLVDTEIRLSTEVVAVASALRDLRDDFRKDRALRARVEDHEHRIDALEKRTG